MMHCRTGMVFMVVIGWALLTGFSPDINVEFARLHQFGLTHVEFDEDNDGSIDSVERYSFNAAGMPERIDVDEGNDGSVDSTISYFYNATGKVDREVYDEGNDGIIDEVVYYTYTPDGRIATDEDDHGNDGIDSVDYYYYNPFGYIDREECDAGNNGSIDEVVYYTYDLSWNLEMEESDAGLDGTIDSAEYLFYDASGRLERIEADEPVGFPVEEVEYYRYRVPETCECDLNVDSRCDMRDWLLFGANWGSTGCLAPGVYCACDLNHDGRCDMRDWLLFGQDWGRSDCPLPIDVGGTWQWNEEMSEIVSGDCEDMGEVSTYSLSIVQTGKRVFFTFNDLPEGATANITGSITGDSLFASGTIRLAGGITLTDTIRLTVTPDGSGMSGTLTQTGDSPEVCTGTYLVTASKQGPL